MHVVIAQHPEPARLNSATQQLLIPARQASPSACVTSRHMSKQVLASVSFGASGFASTALASTQSQLRLRSAAGMAVCVRSVTCDQHTGWPAPSKGLLFGHGAPLGGSVASEPLHNTELLLPKLLPPPLPEPAHQGCACIEPALGVHPNAVLMEERSFNLCWAQSNYTIKASNP